MRKLSLPYVYEFKDRHGKPRRYFRRNGVCRTMPDGMTAAAGAYVEALKASEKAQPAHLPCPYPKGSFGALTYLYESTAHYRKELAPTTRRELGYMIKRLRTAHGDKMVRQLTRDDVQRWQDELAERPGTANNMLRAMKVLMNFAVDKGWRDDSPLTRLREMKGGEFRAWTDAEHERFRARWPLGTIQRRAYAIALHTGQRKGDLCRMLVNARNGGFIVVTQQKTGQTLTIPETDDLTLELDAMKTPGIMMLWKTGGGAFSLEHFGSMMRDAIHAALDDVDAKGKVVRATDAVFHGLRNSASKRLADAGCSPHQIMAVTGHKTIRMVEKYTRQANQKRLASAAIVQLRNAREGL